MKRKYYLPALAFALLAAAVWFQQRDDARHSAYEPISEQVEQREGIIPQTKTDSADPTMSKGITAIPGDDTEGTLSPELKQELYRYNELKKSIVFKDDLDRWVAESFAGKGMLNIAARFLTESSKHAAYSSEEEDLRITLIDYVGDAALGRFSFENRTMAKQLLVALLEGPISLSGKEERQAKSLIGDRIELMAYYTQLDIGEARNYLIRHRGYFDHKYLEEGYSNGLYWLGYGKSDIEQMLADAR